METILKELDQYQTGKYLREQIAKDAIDIPGLISLVEEFGAMYRSNKNSRRQKLLLEKIGRYF